LLTIPLTYGSTVLFVLLVLKTTPDESIYLRTYIVMILKLLLLFGTVTSKVKH
jgi:hypothetical protein